jgi:hypothetical protein
MRVEESKNVMLGYCNDIIVKINENVIVVILQINIIVPDG